MQFGYDLMQFEQNNTFKTTTTKHSTSEQKRRTKHKIRFNLTALQLTQISVLSGLVTPTLIQFSLLE